MMARLSPLSTCLASESNLEKRNLMTSLSFSVFDKVDARNDVDVGVNGGVDVGVDDVETRVRREKLVRQPGVG